MKNHHQTHKAGRGGWLLGLLFLLVAPGLAPAQSVTLGMPKGNSAPATTFFLLAEGKLAVKSSSNATTHFWDLAEGKLIHEYTYGSGSSVTPDGRYVTVNEELYAITGRNAENVLLSFVPVGMDVLNNQLLQYDNGTITRWAYPLVEKVGSTKLEGAPPAAVNIVGQGRYAAFENRVWSTETGRLVGTITLPDLAKITDVDTSGSFAVVDYIAAAKSVGDAGEVQRISLKTGEVVGRYGLNLSSAVPIFDHSGEHLIVPDRGKGFNLLRTEGGRVSRHIQNEAFIATRMELLEDGKGLRLINEGIQKNGELLIIDNDQVTWRWDKENEVIYDAPHPTIYDLHTLDDVTEANDTTTRGVPRPRISLPPQEIRDQLAGVPNEEQRKAKERLTRLLKDDGYNPTAAAYGEGELWVAGLNNGYIMLFNRPGQPAETLSGHTNTVTDLAFNADNTLLFSTAKDGKTIIWDVKEERPLATLILLQGSNWVVTDADGRFDAAPGAMEQLYFVVADKKMDHEIIRFDQMKEGYYDPGLLQKILGYSAAEPRWVRSLEEVELFPTISLEVKNDNLDVRLGIRPDQEGKIGKVSLLANGKLLEDNINPHHKKHLVVHLKKYQKHFWRDNTLEVIAYNPEGTLHSQAVSIPYESEDGVSARNVNGDGPGFAETDARLTVSQMKTAKLFVITVGTSDYAETTDGESMDLKFPNDDAERMARALKQVGTPLFGSSAEVKPICLTTEQDPGKEAEMAAEGISWKYADKKNILAAFKEVADQAGPQDVVVTYFSGHGKTYAVGENTGGQFYYLTSAFSAATKDGKDIEKAGLSTNEITTMLSDIAAYRQVLIIDACESGRIIDDMNTSARNFNGSRKLALTLMSDRMGLYLITGSAADKESFEANTVGQGLLTYSLLKGMMAKNEALSVDDQYLVEIRNLFNLAETEVILESKKLGREQRPQIVLPPKNGNIPVGIINESTVIELAGKKPAIVSVVLQEETSMGDPIFLSNQVISRLRTDGREKDALFVFSSGLQDRAAYQVGGRYTIGADGTYTLQAKLIQGKVVTPLQRRFRGQDGPITGKTAAEMVEALAAAINKVFVDKAEADRVAQGTN